MEILVVTLSEEKSAHCTSIKETKQSGVQATWL